MLQRDGAIPPHSQDGRCHYGDDSKSIKGMADASFRILRQQHSQ